jgi:hypothetical protein
MRGGVPRPLGPGLSGFSSTMLDTSFRELYLPEAWFPTAVILGNQASAVLLLPLAEIRSLEPLRRARTFKT